MSRSARFVRFPTSARSSRRRRSGFALEATLFMMLLFAVMIGAAMTAVRTFTRTSGFDYRSSAVSYAAEGGADDIMAQLEVAMQDGVITATDVAGLTPPTMQGFRFDQDTRTTAMPISRAITSGPFAGLLSLNQPMDIEVTARDSSANSASVILSVNAQSIPLFQFGVFYERDLEILPGPTMEFEGWVHSNGNIYVDGPLNFRSNITTPDSLFRYRKDRLEQRNGVRVANNAGTLRNLTFDSRSAPGQLFVQNSQRDFNGRVMTAVSGVRPLRLPLPTGLDPVELIRPRMAGDAPATREVKMSWKADFYVTVDLARFRALARLPRADTAIRVNTPCSGTPILTISRSGGRPLPSAAECDQLFDVIANAFYDGREDLRPDLVDLDVAQLRSWVAVDPTLRRTDIIFVEFINALAGDDRSDYPALRMQNGQELPSSWSLIEPGGLSVTTHRALYVRGNYNTINWKPAALFGDCLTYLSPAWDDNQQYTPIQRSASASMSVFAALATGHSETPWDYQRAGVTAQYGGGLENFPRFLENWSGRTLTYRGSLVSLFQSQFSLGQWNNTIGGGGYYSAPNRDWRFDLRFRDPRNLPPGTPRVGTVIQTAYRSIY
jgi:hypothetical protein